MNRIEYIEYELEGNVKKREKLKIDYQEKDKEYHDAVEESENSNFDDDIEGKKQFLHTLQEKHRKENAELKERQRLECEGAQWDYSEAKARKSSLVSQVKSERLSIQKELTAIKKEDSELNKERRKLNNLNKFSISSHSIVQYLDRALGMDIKRLRQEVKEARKRSDYNYRFNKNEPGIPDHETIDFLIRKGAVDLKKVEEEMVPENIKKTILSDELLGTTGTFKRKDGFRLVVKNSTIVTFLPKESKSKRKGNFHGKRDKKKPRKMKL